MTRDIEPSDIEAAEHLIRPYIRNTPMIHLSGADFGVGARPISLKLEYMQHSGSFKCRGAFMNLLSREVPAAGVVAASGGNHGSAVAYAAMKRGVPARIYVPSISSPAKIERIRQYGADLVVGGDRYADALAASEEWVAESGALSIHAFDQAETIIGQGTIAREIEADAPDVDTVLVSVGGGGLIGGVAAWYAGRTKIVGVEPEEAPTLARAFEAGAPIDAPAGGVAADSLAPKRIGENVFRIARQHVDQVALVTDAAIRDAQKRLWDILRVVVEPGGAAAFAAVLSGAYETAPDERLAVILSGANTTAVDFDR